MNLNTSPQISIGISARHIHLTQEHADILFGGGRHFDFIKRKELIGGEYATESIVTIVSPKLKAIENVRVLGPVRKASQLEISKTDALKLGIDAPYRYSGDLKGSAGISVVGVTGSIFLPEGCIIAKRHIHMSPHHAEKLSVVDKQLVSVKFDGERSGIFENCMVRIGDNYRLEMHIDTDEANAFGLNNGSTGFIIV